MQLIVWVCMWGVSLGVWGKSTSSQWSPGARSAAQPACTQCLLWWVPETARAGWRNLSNEGIYTEVRRRRAGSGSMNSSCLRKGHSRRLAFAGLQLHPPPAESSQ